MYLLINDTPMASPASILFFRRCLAWPLVLGVRRASNPLNRVVHLPVQLLEALNLFNRLTNAT